MKILKFGPKRDADRVRLKVNDQRWEDEQDGERGKLMGLVKGWEDERDGDREDEGYRSTPEIREKMSGRSLSMLHRGLHPTGYLLSPAQTQHL
ncbi:hypothetical protein ACLOJK_016755 [Asimina triloba]